LYAFISRRGVVDWPMLGAASLWAMVPLLVVVTAFHRRLVAGLSRGDPGGG
jgi:ABC-type glycerol-3-phosphate transport system permease component